MHRISGDTCSARATRRGSSHGNLGRSRATVTVDAAMAGVVDGVWPGSVAAGPSSGKAANEPRARVASSSLAMVRDVRFAGPAGTCACVGCRVLMVFLLHQLDVFDAMEEGRSWNRAPCPGSDRPVTHLSRASSLGWAGGLPITGDQAATPGLPSCLGAVVDRELCDDSGDVVAHRLA